MELYDIQTIEKGLCDIKTTIPHNSFLQLRKVLENSLKKIHEPMQLAIMGKICSSKSTLVNAILGKQLMTMGEKELTYNVGWLKYGNPEDDIIIHYKDGSRSPKRKSEFAKWADNITVTTESDNISYIEVFDDSEILKEINIIDTPGLDSLKKKDSENTLNFIANVRPDAVIMLFTHSVAKQTLDIVRQYNQGGSFNPLNAVGVISKIDLLWQEDFHRKESAIQIGNRIALNMMKKNPELKKTLFKILPTSAMQFLASTTINEETLDNLKTLLSNDAETLDKSLDSPDDFLNNDLKLGKEKKKKLIDCMGIYGLSLSVKQLREKPECTLEELRNILKIESGAKEFTNVLHNHFGARAKLIKLESIYQNIMQAIEACRVEASNNNSKHLLSKIEQQVNALFVSQVQEHKEYELLNKIYNKEIGISADTRNEICNLLGENGFSAPQRLGYNDQSPSPEVLLSESMERERYWRGCIGKELDPIEREWMKPIVDSYSRLNTKLKTSIYQYEQAKAFLFN